MSAVMTATVQTRSDSFVDPTERDLPFDRNDFDRVRRLIYQRAGISLGDGKQAMVYSRVSRRLRETGHPSFVSYLQWPDTAEPSSRR